MQVCERCGRVGRTEIAACLEQRSGGCPYAQQTRGIMPILGMGLIAAGVVEFVVFTIAGIALLMNNRNLGLLFIVLCGISTFLTATPMVGVGVVLALGRRQWRRDLTTGATEQRISLQEREVYHTLTSPTEKLHFGFPGLKPMTYPPSVVAVLLHPPSGFPRSLTYWNQYAVEVLLSGLVGLLADDMLYVHSAKVTRTLIGMKRAEKTIREYFFLLPEGENPGDRSGFVEGRILKAIARWPDSPAAQNWSQGMPTYHLGVDVVGGVSWNPGRWLFQQVRKDAISRGLWHNKGGRIHGQGTTLLKEEGEASEALVRYLSATHQEFLGVLRVDFRRALADMEWSYIEQP